MSITAGGLYTLSTSIREDSLRLDRLLLTTNTNYIPTGFGPAETVRQTNQMAPLTTLTRTLTYTTTGFTGSSKLTIRLNLPPRPSSPLPTSTMLTTRWATKRP